MLTQNLSCYPELYYYRGDTVLSKSPPGQVVVRNGQLQFVRMTESGKQGGIKSKRTIIVCRKTLNYIYSKYGVNIFEPLRRDFTCYLDVNGKLELMTTEIFLRELQENTQPHASFVLISDRNRAFQAAKLELQLDEHQIFYIDVLSWESVFISKKNTPNDIKREFRVSLDSIKTELGLLSHDQSYIHPSIYELNNFHLISKLNASEFMPDSAALRQLVKSYVKSLVLGKNSDLSLLSVYCDLSMIVEIEISCALELPAVIFENVEQVTFSGTFDELTFTKSLAKCPNVKYVWVKDSVLAPGRVVHGYPNVTLSQLERVDFNNKCQIASESLIEWLVSSTPKLRELSYISRDLVKTAKLFLEQPRDLV